MTHANTLVDNYDIDRSIESTELVISILHVEDDETVALITREILEAQGWQVDTCADGKSALEKISGNVRYDFLLVDPDLPDGNGLELVNHARKLVHRSRTPIGVLSAHLVEAEAREAGADVFLWKPHGIVSLPEAITRLLCERRQ